MEENLKKRPEYAAIFNCTVDAIIFVDQQRRIVNINPAFTSMFGYALEELAGQTTRLIYANPEHYSNQGRQRFNPEAVIDQPMFENEYRRKDSTTFFGETIAVHVLEESGELLGFAGIIHDTTERKQIEDKIRDSEELFKALFEQASGYAMILQPTSSGIPTILDVNKAACQAHGYARDEMIGRPVVDLDNEEGKRLCRERTKKIINEGTLDIVTDHVRKDGSVFPVEVHASLVRFTKKPPLILTTEYDITKRKKAEIDLLVAKSELDIKNKYLEEANIALNVLIRQQEKNKEELEKNVLFNVEKLLMPTLGKLKNQASDHNQKAYLDVLELNLNHITSPFLPKVASHLAKLTPAQIQVANLIKQGMTTKEIANLLNLSPATIAVQRQQIRKRLAVPPQTSLRTVLLTSE